MKKYIYILLFIISLLYLGCEQIDVIESSIPYQEFKIVNGRLIGDSTKVEISFTKSFPIEQDLSRDDVALKNVTAYIWSETQGIFPLKHNNDGIYSPVNEMYILQGTKYELYAEVNGERIYSESTVPVVPEIAEVKLEGEYLKCTLVPNNGAVYGAKYVVQSLNNRFEIYNDSTFFEITNKTVDSTNSIEVRTSNIPLEYYQSPDEYSVKMILYSFDESYRDYFLTRENNKPIENIFSEGGGSVYWNVYGENTIGLFIGYNKTTIAVK